MSKYIWDGPEDSDEEVPEMVPFKAQHEKDMGVKYSKNGLIEFIEAFHGAESANSKTDPQNAKLWIERLNIPGITMWMKKGGSQWSKDQPFLRNNVVFNKTYKMEKVLSTVSKLLPIFTGFACKI